MEKDSMVAHGIGQFLKERMMESSDITKAMVCDKCGMFATKVMDKDYYVCNNCNNHTEFSDVAMPYAFKLMCQELTAVNIVPRIRAEKIDL
jgi:DNA-directed RNA polymerase II subunit RPB2